MKDLPKEAYDFTVNGYVPPKKYTVRYVALYPALDIFVSLSSAVMAHLKSVGYNGDVDASSLAKAMTTLATLRILQVARKRLPPGYRSVDIRVWSFMFPLLAQIGRFRNEKEGFELVPVPFESNEEVSPEAVEALNQVTRDLQYWGLSYSMGLPKDVDVENDDFYRLILDQEGNVTGNGEKPPTPVAVASRLLYDVSAIAGIYAEPRAVYTTVRFLQDTIIDVVASRLKHPSSVKT